MNEENDEYGEIVSSAPKRMRCSTSFVWLDFEILPKGFDEKGRAKCKKCQNSFVVGSSGTLLLCCIIEKNAMRLIIKVCLVSLWYNHYSKQFRLNRNLKVKILYLENLTQ